MPDLNFQDLTIRNPIYVTFVDGVRKHVGDYLPLVCCHLQRKAYDKMSVVAAETALLALNFFDLQEQIVSHGFIFKSFFFPPFFLWCDIDTCNCLDHQILAQEICCTQWY